MYEKDTVQDGFYSCHSFLLHVLPFTALYHVNNEFILILFHSLGISVWDNIQIMQPKCIYVLPTSATIDNQDKPSQLIVDFTIKHLLLQCRLS